MNASVNPSVYHSALQALVNLAFAEKIHDEGDCQEAFDRFRQMEHLLEQLV